MGIEAIEVLHVLPTLLWLLSLEPMVMSSTSPTGRTKVISDHLREQIVFTLG